MNTSDIVAISRRTLFPALEVQGFRRLRDVNLELRPLTVLIGANGVGKTSILDILELLARSARGELNAALSELSGLPAILTYDAARELRLAMEMDVAGNHPLRYELCVKPQGTAYGSGESMSRAKSSPESSFATLRRATLALTAAVAPLM